MNITEIIEQIYRNNPGLLNSVPENKAAALIRHVFKHVGDTVARTEEGVVNYAGLGRFRVKKVEKEIDGKKVVSTRVIFQPTGPGKDKDSDGA